MPLILGTLLLLTLQGAAVGEELLAAKGHVNPSFWMVTSQGLLEAAKAVGAAAPSILATAGRLAEWFTASS